MFQHLFELEYKRTPLQAVGFYLAYFVIIVVMAGLMGGAGVMFTDADTAEEGYVIGQKIGVVVAIVSCFAFAALTVHRKKLSGHVGYVLLIFVAGGLAALGGAVLGLLPIAYLTTVPIKTTHPTTP